MCGVVYALRALIFPDPAGWMVGKFVRLASVSWRILSDGRCLSELRNRDPSGCREA